MKARRKWGGASFVPDVRGVVVVLLLALVCLLPALTSPPSSFTQSQTRPRRASSQPTQTPSSGAARDAEAGRRAGARPTPAVEASKTPDPAAAEGPQAVGDDEVVRVEASEVLVPVTVRDASGRLVKDLTRTDFRVFEDGREQPLSELALRQVPVDVALLLDSSSSVAASLDDFRRAVDDFAAQLTPEDRICLVKFDDRVELLQDWTASRLQLQRSLRRVATGMFTRFYDALYLTAREQFGTNQRRHAVVVLSDGIDSRRGEVTMEATLASLLQAQATVYVIANTRIERARKQEELDGLLGGTDASVRFNQLRIDDLRLGLKVLEASEQNLDRLAEVTGGNLYTPDSFAQLQSIYREVAGELRHQYALYYTPLNKAGGGEFRRVEVSTHDPSFKVSTRLGYYAQRQ